MVLTWNLPFGTKENREILSNEFIYVSSGWNNTDKCEEERFQEEEHTVTVN